VLVADTRHVAHSHHGVKNVITSHRYSALMCFRGVCRWPQLISAVVGEKRRARPMSARLPPPSDDYFRKLVRVALRCYYCIGRHPVFFFGGLTACCPIGVDLGNLHRQPCEVIGGCVPSLNCRWVHSAQWLFRTGRYEIDRLFCRRLIYEKRKKRKKKPPLPISDLTKKTPV
jgi:hypothetical protein